MHKPLTIEERARLLTDPADRRMFLADFIESGKDFFSMDCWYATECKTPSCMAGWATYFWGDYDKAVEENEGADDDLAIVQSFPEQAVKILDVPVGVFYMTHWKRDDVAHYLRTGEEGAGS